MMSHSLCPEKCCTTHKRECCTNQAVYECPPPPPLEVKCSVCCNAENDGQNIWSCVPFVSYPTFLGLTLAEVTIHVLNMLPISVICWLAIGHPKLCIEIKPEPKCCEPITERRQNKLCPEKCGQGDCEGENLNVWMHQEYISLAQELANLKRLTCDEDGDEHAGRELLQARNYVLDRLAEMLAKREEIEKSLKHKIKQKGR